MAGPDYSNIVLGVKTPRCSTMTYIVQYCGRDDNRKSSEYFWRPETQQSIPPGAATSPHSGPSPPETLFLVAPHSTTNNEEGRIARQQCRWSRQWSRATATLGHADPRRASEMREDPEILKGTTISTIQLPTMAGNDPKRRSSKKRIPFVASVETVQLQHSTLQQAKFFETTRVYRPRNQCLKHPIFAFQVA